jgi:stearoyl-CoA desaturase (Delta-9 desaturase)
MSTAKSGPVQDWLNTIVLFSTPLLALFFVPYHWINHGGFTAFEWGCFAFFMFATGTGITAGYHRLWSHNAYKAHVLVRLWYAYWGGCATQNSIIKWSADHRRHHKFVDDKVKDPYAATKGFWWAHMGWILKTEGPIDMSNVKDLEKDWVVVWQEKLYLFLVLLSNVLVPLGLGWLYNVYTGTNQSIYGVLILAGLFRFVLNHHFTFFINSACHFFGNQPYSSKDTSRDNFILALFTYGEGYHNYHHSFQVDYRNGIRWYHYDPTKWVTKALSYVGLTSNLKKMPDCQIEKQVIMNKVNLAKEKCYERLSLGSDKPLCEKLEKAYENFALIMNEWLEANNKFSRFCREKRQALEKLPYEEKLKTLKFAIDEQKKQLMDLFQASSIDQLHSI